MCKHIHKSNIIKVPGICLKKSPKHNLNSKQVHNALPLNIALFFCFCELFDLGCPTVWTAF